MKPCPFCGSEAVVEPEGITPCGYWVKCSECGIEQPRPYETQDEAIAAWNDRPSYDWTLHEETNTWECSQCHACFELDGGNPKYLNYCPVCGTKLELPD